MGVRWISYRYSMNDAQKTVVNKIKGLLLSVTCGILTEIYKEPSIIRRAFDIALKGVYEKLFFFYIFKNQIQKEPSVKKGFCFLPLGMIQKSFFFTLLRYINATRGIEHNPI